MHILVTGGAGYIGSHTIIELVTSGHTVVVIDNLVNSSLESLNCVGQLVGQDIPFFEGDVRDEQLLEQLFNDHAFDAVIHFAGLKAVGESVEQPVRYYDTNLLSTIVLCRVMERHNVRQLVFSSSATVYGNGAPPYAEDAPLSATNPYGWTKLMNEQILRDVAATNTGWQISLLRYFNPIGAHPSGMIGENPNGTPNNLLPFVTQVAIGKRPSLAVYGNDYDTPDGTCLRDYIHVVDLARGHVAALEHAPAKNSAEAYNLGTGKPSSVLEVITALEQASGKQVPYQTVDRRPGDAASSYAIVDKARDLLNWQATHSLAEACADSWRWQSQNPNGF